ncbi:unnamed protein product [Discosporangium mesarthrocarpum]
MCKEFPLDLTLRTSELSGKTFVATNALDYRLNPAHSQPLFISSAVKNRLDMVDSMDEEELGGVFTASEISGGGLALGPLECDDPLDGAGGGPAPHSRPVWARKRRVGEQAIGGSFSWRSGNLPSTGRDSPLSDQSSSTGSDIGINQGIKRIRLSHGSSSDSNGSFSNGSSAATNPPPLSLPIFREGPRSGSAFTLSESSRAVSIPSQTAVDGLDKNLLPGLPRTSATGAGRHSGLGLGEPLEILSHHLPASLVGPDDRPAIALQSPVQPQYLRGIRVQAGAPRDVDYSSVNVALRQLHMERRLGGGAAGRGGGGGGVRRQDQGDRGGQP